MVKNKIFKHETPINSMQCPICDSDNVEEEYEHSSYSYRCKECNYEWE
jgi:transposase-like protein